MKYYCLMVRTGEEERFKSGLLKEFGDTPSLTAYFFKKRMRTNKGQFFEQALFPGYVFCGIERLEVQIVERMKKLHGFFRFLISNTDIRPLAGDSLLVFENFLRCGLISSCFLLKARMRPRRRFSMSLPESPR